jgi:hypothetical protein
MKYNVSYATKILNKKPPINEAFGIIQKALECMRTQASFLSFSFFFFKLKFYIYLFFNKFIYFY